MTFETNSSSMHSLIITKNDVHIDPDNIVWDINKYPNPSDTVSIDKNGRLDLDNIVYGYGRDPFQILTTFKEKLQYAMCEFLGDLYIDDPEYEKIYNEFKRIVKKIIPQFTDFYITKKHIDIYVDKNGNHILQKDLDYDDWNEKENRPEYYYLDENGNKCPAVLDEEDEMVMPNIGMIDHQSAGLLKSFLKNRNISLEEFLTNKRYTIVVDGDEYFEFQKYLESGFIDKDFIVERISNYSDC